MNCFSLSTVKGNKIAIIVRVEPSGNPQSNAGPESPKKGTLTTVQHQLSSAAGTNGVALTGATSGPSGLSAGSTAAQTTNTSSSSTTSTPTNVAIHNGASAAGTAVEASSSGENNSPVQIPSTAPTSAADITMAPPSVVPVPKTTASTADQAAQLGHSIKQVAN